MSFFDRQAIPQALLLERGKKRHKQYSGSPSQATASDRDQVSRWRKFRNAMRRQQPAEVRTAATPITPPPHISVSEAEQLVIDINVNLASTYQDQGRWDKAEKLEVEVLEAETKVLGEGWKQDWGENKSKSLKDVEAGATRN
ncbi:hypothetical protein LTR95_017520 [Oleoguttula sp. CCFEE 5521]